MTHFNLSYLSSLICCHPSRFDTSEYYCSNLLNKFITNRDHEDQDLDDDEEELARPTPTTTRNINVDFVSNYSSSPSTITRPVSNCNAPYYYGDIAYHQSDRSGLNKPRATNSVNIWNNTNRPFNNDNNNNYNFDRGHHHHHHHHHHNHNHNHQQQSRSRYSIMDGLRIQFKNQVRNHSNQYLRSPNVHRSDEFKVSLRGWLFRLEGAALKQWKRRWCVLADYCLFYYKDMKEEKMLGSLLLPSYKISPCFNRDGISKKFAFKAEHNNMKTYYFSADSKEIQQQWMNALSMASIMQLSAIFSAVNEMNQKINENGGQNHHNHKSHVGNNNHDNNNSIITDDPNGVLKNHKESSLSASQQHQQMVIRPPPGTTTTINNNNTIDDESGFVAYHQSKRLDETGDVVASSMYLTPSHHHHQNLHLNSNNTMMAAAAGGVPPYQMYNSIGLPMFYPNQSAGNPPHQHFLNDYINAPPKPQRQYYDLMLPYNLPSASNLMNTSEFFNPNSNSNYHNYFVTGHHLQHPHPRPQQLDNCVPYIDYLQVNQRYVENYHQNQNMSNGVEDTINHHVVNSQFVNDQRLPPRPHSADFLERNQELDEECETLFLANSKPDEYAKADEMHQDHRIMPTRPKSSIEKYDSFNKGLYGLKPDFREDHALNGAFLPVLTETIPSRPPLPQEYVYGYQKSALLTMANNDPKSNLLIIDQANKPLDKETTTYTSDDEIFAKTNLAPQMMTMSDSNHPNSIVDQSDPFELSKEEYYQASKMFFQKQTRPQPVPLTSGASTSGTTIVQSTNVQPNLGLMKQNDWNEIGLPIPNPTIPYQPNHNSLLRKVIQDKNPVTFAAYPNGVHHNGASANAEAIQNQSNEGLEIKFKLGLNVRTYRRPKLFQNSDESGTNYDESHDDTSLEKMELHNPPTEWPMMVATSENDENNDGKKKKTIESDLVSSTNSGINNNSNNSNSSSAPYYYSDLLSEEQKIALQKKLGNFASPPPLLSRCQASSNTRFLGTTSLKSNQKSGEKPSGNDHTENGDGDGDDGKQQLVSVDMGKSKSKCSPTNKSLKTNLDNLTSKCSTMVDGGTNGTNSCETISDDPTINRNCDNNDQANNDDDDNCGNRETVSPDKYHEQQQQQQQHIYENCAETKKLSPSKNHPTQPERISADRNTNNTNNNNNQPREKTRADKKQRKFESKTHSLLHKNNKTILNSSSIDSLHETPVESTKKKRRKRKSRENVNNASDSEIPLNVDRRNARRGFLKSSRRLSASAAEHVGKSQEELILMLIQLRRKQSQLAKTCEKLRIQMDSEEKMMEIEPFRMNDYKFRFDELNREWNEVNKEYELQLPIIQTIDHMIKIKSKFKLNELNKKKAASTSVLDKVVDENRFDNSQSWDSDSNQTADTPNENIETLKKQQRLLEGELDRVREMLTHSTKQLEEKAVENAQMEQEMLIARNKLKQVLENEQEAMEITRSSKLEAELAHINHVIDDLHSRRKELNNAIENLKNSEANFAKSFGPEDTANENIYLMNNYTRFSGHDDPLPESETGLYPLYENIKKSKEYMELDAKIDPELDDRTNGSNLNDEFFTLNINLDKQPKMLLNLKGHNGTQNEINNNEFQQNLTINTMCEFDPNKDMALAYGDSIVDQQIKQIYNYQSNVSVMKPNEVKTVREVKRESERRKFQNQNQQVNRANIFTRANYESYVPLSNHHHFDDNNDGNTILNNDSSTYFNHNPQHHHHHHHQQHNDLENQMKQFNLNSNTEQISPQSFNAPDIVQSTIKLSEKK